MMQDANTQKEIGQESVLRHADAVIPNWSDMAVETIRMTASIFGTVTSEDVRILLPVPPHHNAIGSAFSTASKMGIIKRIGYRQSTSPAAHGRVIAVWEEARP